MTGDSIPYWVAVGVYLSCALAMNFAEHPSMNFKDSQMKKRYLTVSVDVKNGETSLFVHIHKYVAVKGAPDIFKQYEYEGYDPQYQYYKDVGVWNWKASSFTGLASGVFANLRDILTVLGENGFYVRSGYGDDERLSAGMYDRFNTGNDFKLVCQFVDFLSEISHKE